MFKIALSLIIILTISSHAFARQNVSVEDRIIGSTFKTLAKAFVAASDINRLKKDNIYKLSKMDNTKFQKRYAKVYPVIKELPEQLRMSYGISEYLGREEAIKDIESLDKLRLYEIIDAIPDTVIAAQFRQHLTRKKEEIQKINLVGQIKKIWAKIIEKTKRPRQENRFRR